MSSINMLNTEWKYKNYQEAIKLNYVLAIQTKPDGSCAYKGFNVLQDGEPIYEKSKITEYDNQKSLFEVINTKKWVKPYFDGDKVNLTRTEFNLFLDKFIHDFNIYYRTSITINDILIYYRDDNTTELITSFHIIVSKRKIYFNNILNFILFFNVKNLNYINILDVKIYSNHRLFNLPFNTKQKYIHKDDSNIKLFVPYKKQDDSIASCFISNTGHIVDEFKLTQNAPIKTSLIIRKHLLKNAFQKMKHHNIPIPIESPVEEKMYTYYFDGVTNSVDFLILNLNKDFFLSETDWVLVTLILKKFKLNSSKVKAWLEYSSKITQNKWSLTENQTWYISKNVKKLMFGVPKFIEIVNRYLLEKITLDLDYNLIHYLALKTNLNKDFLKDLLDKFKSLYKFEENSEDSSDTSSSNNTMVINDIFSYNFKTGFLYKHITETSKDILNQIQNDKDRHKLIQNNSINILLNTPINLKNYDNMNHEMNGFLKEMYAKNNMSNDQILKYKSQFEKLAYIEIFKKSNTNTKTDSGDDETEYILEEIAHTSDVSDEEEEVTNGVIIPTEYSDADDTDDEIVTDTPVKSKIYDPNIIINRVKVKGNYFIDECLKQEHKHIRLNNIVEIDDIKKMKRIAKQFIRTDNETILSVKAKWGSGKTYIIVKTLIEYARKHKIRVIILTENNALNLKYSIEFNIQSHLDSKFNPKKSFVCSIESISKVSYKKTDILILDEFETILSHFESDTHKKNAFEHFGMFKLIVATIDKVCVLDADISNDRIELLSNIKKRPIITYDVKTNNFKDYKFNVIVRKPTFKRNIIKSLQLNNKITIPSSSKNFNNQMYNEILARINNKKVLKIDSDGALIGISIDGVITESSHKISDIEEFILDNNIDAFLYSPSIKTGISINSTYFHKVYAYASHKSCVARVFIQMLFRARNLIKKEINMFIGSNFGKVKPFVNKINISRTIITPIINFQTQRIFNSNFATDSTDDVTQLTDENDFLILKLINAQEIYNSNTRFIQDCIMRLQYNHGIKINYIDTDYELDKEEIPNLIKDSVLESFVKCDLVALDEFLVLEDKDWEKKKKHNFFNKYFFVNGISNELYYDTNIYDFVNTELFYKTNYKLFNQYNLIKNSIEDDVTKSNNKSIDDIKQLNEAYLVDVNLSENKLNKYEARVASQILTLNLLNALKINLLKVPFCITNKDWTELLENFKTNGFLTKLLNYKENYEVEFNKKMLDVNHTSYIKNLISIVKKMLGDLNISIVYTNKNTKLENTKLQVCYHNFNSIQIKCKSKFAETKTPLAFDKIDDLNKISKIRTAHIYKTEDNTSINVYKKNNYYVTYKPEISKNIKKLKSNIITFKNKLYDEFLTIMNPLNNDDLNPDLTIANLKHLTHTDLMNYLMQKHRPQIVSESTFKKNESYIKEQLIDHNKNRFIYNFLASKHIDYKLITTEIQNDITNLLNSNIIYKEFLEMFNRKYSIETKKVIKRNNDDE